MDMHKSHSSSEISVVVQGAVIPKETARCLRSIRKVLPNAEIILSTWKGTDISGFDYDFLVLSDDPGSIGLHYLTNKVIQYNFNRQLISTKAGLEAATKKYVIKIRTDFYLKNTNFLRFFDSFPLRHEEHCFFRHHLIVPSIFSRRFSEQTGFPLPFHPSDFFFFGLREDVLDYFSHCALLDKRQGCNWHHKFPDRKPYLSETGRFTAEQELCLAWIKSHGIHVQYDDFSDWNENLLDLSDKILFNNFIFLDAYSMGLRSKKHKDKIFNARYAPWYGLVTQKIFEEKYKEIYDNFFILKKYSENKKLYYLIKKLSILKKMF